METKTLTLAEFLLARIAEDEAPAKALADEQLDMRRILGEDNSGPTRDEEYAALNIGVDRVLAECEAKRRIVEELGQPRLRDAVWMRIGWGDWLLRALAAVYSDHPDYREEWA